MEWVYTHCWVYTHSIGNVAYKIVVYVFENKLLTFFNLRNLKFLLLQVLVQIGIIAFCSKKATFDDDHAESDEEEPTLYYDTSTDVLEHISNTKKLTERPKIDKNFYNALKIRKNQEQEMKQLLRDITIYICYVMLVFIIRNELSLHQKR